jgi:hypothetical protein
MHVFTVLDINKIDVHAVIIQNLHPPTPHKKIGNDFTIAPSFLPGGGIRNSQTETTYRSTIFTPRVHYLTCVNFTSTKLRNISNSFLIVLYVTPESPVGICYELHA